MISVLLPLSRSYYSIFCSFFEFSLSQVISHELQAQSSSRNYALRGKELEHVHSPPRPLTLFEAGVSSHVREIKVVLGRIYYMLIWIRPQASGSKSIFPQLSLTGLRAGGSFASSTELGFPATSEHGQNARSPRSLGCLLEAFLLRNEEGLEIANTTLSSTI